MPFQYEVQQWSTGQVAFKMPGNRDIELKDLGGPQSQDFIREHMKAESSSRFFDRSIPFKGIYAPKIKSIAKGQPAFYFENVVDTALVHSLYKRGSFYGGNDLFLFEDAPSSKTVEIMHKYIVEKEGDNVLLEMDLSTYTDKESRQKALAFIDTSAELLRLNTKFKVSVKIIGPDAENQITIYEKAKKDRLTNKIYSDLGLHAVLWLPIFIPLAIAFIVAAVLAPPVMVAIGLATGGLLFVAGIGLGLHRAIALDNLDARCSQEHMQVAPSIAIAPSIQPPEVDHSFQPSVLPSPHPNAEPAPASYVDNLSVNNVSPSVSTTNLSTNLSNSPVSPLPSSLPKKDESSSFKETVKFFQDKIDKESAQREIDKSKRGVKKTPTGGGS